MGGNVGIGTTIPGYLFDVNIGANSIAERLIGSGLDSPVIRFENTSASGGRTYHVGSTGSGSGAGNGFSIYDVTGGAARLLINPNGNVGIGTTSPSNLLSFGNAITNPTLAIFENAGGTNLYGARLDTTAFRLGLYTNGSERLSVNMGGNVGIGSTAPTQALDVNGTVRAAHVSITGSSCSWSGWACSPTCAAGYYQAGTMMGAANNCNGTGPNVQIYCCSF